MIIPELEKLINRDKKKKGEGGWGGDGSGEKIEKLVSIPGRLFGT